MYIAFKRKNHKPVYLLRESCTIDGQLTFRNLFDLGADPSLFITYAGGNAFYFDEKIEDALSELGVDYDPDELEDLFWPWIRPDIKRAIDTFRNRSKNSYKKLTVSQKNHIAQSVHYFDKRRTHYLKFGGMDQGSVENMPVVLFKDLINKSRDEIEQNFRRQEFSLKIHELKSYVYTVFDLQSFFAGFMAKTMPHALDQEKVDSYFLKEICRLNLEMFNKKDVLHGYLIRYAIMFFDHTYADTTLLDEFAKDFMFRRNFTPRPQNKVSVSNACKLFDLAPNELKTMTKKLLTKRYRRMARKHHPDKGGSNEEFVKLNNAYETLLGRIK